MAMRGVAMATRVACKLVFRHWKLLQLLTPLRVFLPLSTLMLQLLLLLCSESEPSKLWGQNHNTLRISSHWTARPAPL